jgi:hypothetical protein
MFTGRSAYDRQNWREAEADARVDPHLFETRSFAWPRVGEAGDMFRVRGKDELAHAVDLDHAEPFPTRSAEDLYGALKRVQRRHQGQQREQLHVRVASETVPVKNLLQAAIHLQMDQHGGNDPVELPCLCICIDAHRYEQLKLLLTILDVKGKKNRDTFTCEDIRRHLQWIANQVLPRSDRLGKRARDEEEGDGDDGELDEEGGGGGDGIVHSEERPHYGERRGSATMEGHGGSAAAAMSGRGGYGPPTTTRGSRSGAWGSTTMTRGSGWGSTASSRGLPTPATMRGPFVGSSEPPRSFEKSRTSPPVSQKKQTHKHHTWKDDECNRQGHYHGGSIYGPTTVLSGNPVEIAVIDPSDHPVSRSRTRPAPADGSQTIIRGFGGTGSRNHGGRGGQTIARSPVTYRSVTPTN